MNGSPEAPAHCEHCQGEPGDAGEQEVRRELPPRARTIGVIVWCSFLAASGATMIVFAFLDPNAFAQGVVPAWWSGRHAVYAIGFIFFWLVAACSAALTIYIAHTDRPARGGTS